MEKYITKPGGVGKDQKVFWRGTES